MLRLLRSSGRSLPPGFFTPSNTRAGGSAATAAEPAWSRVQRFSDSSRSRPPSRSRKDGASPAKAAAATVSKSALNNGQPTPSVPVEGQDGAESQPDTNAEGPSIQAKPSSVAEEPTQATASTKSSSRRGPRFFVHNAPPETPHYLQGLQHVPILTATPHQVALDQFYSSGRPLLEVTLPPSHRHQPSRKDRKMLYEGDKEFELRNQPKARQQAAIDEVADDEPGEYDAYLITEPEGADPAWGEGADRFLASMDHTVSPPIHAPSPSTVSKPPSQKRQNIDYLFPVQAEQRRQAAEDARIASARQSIVIPAHRNNMKAAMAAKGQTGLGNFLRAGRGEMSAPSLASRFLGSQELKSRWSSAWDFEDIRHALATMVKQRQERSAVSSSNKADYEGMKKPLERLRQTSRSVLRTRSQLRRAKRVATVSRQDIPSGELLIISMPDVGDFGGKGASAGDKAAIAKEIHDVIQQAGKFVNFFQKSSADLDGLPRSTSASMEIEIVDIDGESGKFTRRSQAGQSDFLPAEDVVIEDDAGSRTQSDLAKAGLLGPRISIVQASRGRSLRPTLRERLALRGVDLVGSHKTVEMDSVKRKRRKRISKHKSVVAMHDRDTVY
ncbi:hypothetical protein EMMF5_002563 [Cystobasidiomycetes sp. EMM_F5]